MADTRELLLAEYLASGRTRPPWWHSIFTWLKFMLRRAVVATGGTPLRVFYAAIYRLHVRYAVRVLTRFPGTRAVYATRGVASCAIVHGVSDIDLVTVGEWDGEEHARLIAQLRRLCLYSPLYDYSLWQSAHTLTEFRRLAENDYFFRSRLNQGRERWKLLAGTNVVANVPEMPAGRIAGAHFMELKNWWLHFIMSAFGSGPTAREEIFRNSICYKSVAETLSVAAACNGEPLEPSRARAMTKARAWLAPENVHILDRLEQSAKNRHLHYEGDIQDDSLRILLPVLESAHQAIADAPVFRPASGGLSIDAAPGEILLSEAARDHARTIAAHARKSWPGYLGAFLTLSVSCFAQDDLLLLIDCDPARPPDAAQMRELCSMNREARPRLTQRISLYLQLAHGAYQLDLHSSMEMWRVLLTPQANPDVFWLAGQLEFAIDGTPRRVDAAPRWSTFANDLMREELHVRRAAMAATNPAALPSSLEIVRNVFRHLQLEIIVRSTSAGHTLLPLTPAAVERALETWGVPAALIAQFRDAYHGEINGRPSDVRPLIPHLMAMLQGLS